MRKRILSIFLTICIIAATLSIGGAPVSAVPIPDTNTDLSLGNVVINSDGIYTIIQSEGGTTDKTITINSDATVYLDGVNILVPKPTGVSDFSRLNPININGAYEVNLHLVDGSVNTLASENGIGGVSDHNPSMTSGSAKAALRVPAEAKLNIYGDTGILNVTGAQAYNNSDSIAHGGGGAGIGGNGGITYSYAYSPNTSEAESSGTINIYGGMINATGGETTGYWGDGGSGIGSGGKRKDGSHAGSGAVIIHDGTVTVTGGNRGSGSSSTSGYAIGGEITINGGHLIARSASSGATIRSPLSEQPLIPNSYKWWTSEGSDYVLSANSPYIYDANQRYVEISVIPAAYEVEHYKENLEGGYELSNTDSLTGTTATTATASAKIYAGFSENTTHASRISSGTINADGSTVLKLYYYRNVYKVTFQDHDGTSIKTQSVKFEGSATAPTSPNRTGYTFSGWDEDFSSVTSNITVTANYTANTGTAYKVEHYQENLNGSYSLANTDNLTGTTAALVTAAAKTYAGFSENTSHTNRYPSGTINADGSTVLKLYYDRDEYSVTFKDHDGVIIDTQSVKFEGSATAPTSPTIIGYTFSGWNEDFSSVTSDIEVTATYTANTDTAYKVEHYKETLEGSYVLANTDSLTGTTATSATAAAKTYAGFNENTSHTNRNPNGTINADGSTVLKLYYDRDEYSVTFKDHDGVIIDAQSVKFEGSATAPTSPTRTGYTFSGWSSTFNNVTSNITVTANYTANTGTAYQVQHYKEALAGGYELANTDNLTGTTATTATAAAKNYTGFSENTTHDDRVNSGTINADGSTVLKLYYDRNSYTVTFKNYDNTTINTQSVKYEGAATAPTSPTRTGYTFDGWSTTFNNVTSNVTVTATYTANTDTAYQVQHYKETLAGGYELANTDSLTGTTATTATAAAKIYAGFSENTSHTNRNPNGTINADGSTVLKLFYDRDEYSVRYVNHDGSVLATEEVTYGDFTEAPATPVRAYHSFAGWFTDNDTFMNEWVFAEKQVTAATTLYAKWTKIPQSITHVSIDDQTKVAVDGLSNKVNLTETEIESAADIFVFVKADPIQISESIQEKVESEIDRKGLKLLNVFDIGLYKRVTTYEGVSTEASISNEDIIGKIIVRIPLTEEQAKKDNLAIAYIDDEGNITIIAGKIISLGEAKHFEFETDHFSTYSLVETSIVNIPVTGEKTEGRIPLGLLALLLAMGVLIVTKRKLIKEEIE